MRLNRKIAYFDAASEGRLQRLKRLKDENLTEEKSKAESAKANGV
jgi:hypothetical protein